MFDDMHAVTFNITRLGSYDDLRHLIRGTKDGSDDVVPESMTAAEINVAITDIGILIEALDDLRSDLVAMRDAANAAEEELRLKLSDLARIGE